MIIKVTGKKPRELTSPTHIALAVRGTGFWNAVSSAYGEFAASMARYSNYFNMLHAVQNLKSIIQPIQKTDYSNC